ncbi:protein piccolo-like isoform X2 [Ostrea edulis]|uniref:protein piccolo-like isoform X2 n=1 Tax=Ostrea edulis TaxID=37623 RepID=UPI0024AF69D8|nr:protein piccolo-like isoform X2 [Ostrea edulis]XP_056007287.1 protein piccolo-like isoform X2 [Ostrea edulis]
MAFKCEICQRDNFKNEHGLRIHKSKVHAKDPKSSDLGASAAPLTPVNEEARPKIIPSATQDRRKGEGPNGEGSSDLPSSNEKFQSTEEKKKNPITKDVEENENKPSPTRMKSSSSTTREETSEDETAEDDIRSPTGDRKDKENTMTFKCEICQKDTFKTERGLRIHKSKVHAKDRESSNVGANAAPLTPVNEEARPKDIPSETQDRRKGEGPNGEGSSDLPSSNENLQSTDEKEKPPITKDEEENENKPSTTRMKSSSSTMREETSEDETAEDVVRSPSGDRKDTENTMAFKCEICQKDTFKTERGLRIHKSKVHAKDRESSNVGASAAPLTPVNEEARPKDIPSATPDSRKGEGPNGEGSGDLPPSNEKLPSTDQKKKPPITKEVEENENKPSPTRMKSSSSATREETSEDETADDDVRSPTGNRKDKENTMVFKCEICQKDTFKTERGLRIHKSKVHAKDRESSNVGANAAPLTPVNEEARPKDIPSATPHRRKGEGQNGEGSYLPSSNEKLPSTDEKEKPPITKDVEENENKPSPTRMKSSSSTTREETSEDETAEDVVRSPSGDRKDTENTMAFKCEICQKDTFKTERGLRIHKSKVHAKDRESSNVGASAAPLTPVNEEARPKDIPSATPDSRKGEGPNGEGSGDLPPSNEKLPSTDQKKKPPITKDVEENENKPSPTRMKSSSSTTREETSEDETAEDVVRSPSGDRKDTENTMAFKCEICQRDNFKNEHGLRIHKSKVHAKDRESCNVGASTAPLTPVKEETRPKDIPSATGDETKSEGQNGGGSSDLPPSTEKLLSTDEKKKSPIMKDVEENENKPFTTKIKSSSSIKREETSEDETAEDDDKPPTGDRKDTEVVQQIRSAPDQRSNDEGQDVGGNNEDFAQSCTELDFSKYVAMQEACIKRSKHETEIRVERVNKFLKNLQYIMERTSDIPFDVLKSGSYYDKTKIDYDDEFDFMFYPKANMEADFTACPPGYCKIKKGRTTNNNLDSLCNENGYLDPNRFKEYMFNIFKDCIEDETFREGRRTRRKLRLVGSPAFTVLYDLGVVGVKPIEIDLVPAIKVEGWPQTAREISPQWLRDRNFEIATTCFHVVTKTFPEQHPDGDLLWRVSFSHAEQKLILHANQYDNGCRKEVFKLLKKLKENIKYESPSEIDKFCSYHLKMFMLNFYDNHNSFDMKQKETLFKQSIKELAICVRNGNIANYFIPEDNVLHFVSKEENNFVAERLQQLQEKFKL